MSKLLLNCATPLSALESLAAVLNMTTVTLMGKLKEIIVDADDLAEDIEQMLVAKVLTNVCPPDFSVVWFHGTRLHKNHTLNSEGLLPAHSVEPHLRSYLQQLCKGLKPRGESRFATSRAFKPKTEGPFGVLFRTAAISPSGFSGNYRDRPELIDDIAGELLGVDTEKLISRYRENSVSCIVHFIGSPTEKVLTKALRYVFETQIEGCDDVESANSCSSTYFDGKGIAVPPECILEIEHLPDRCSL